jgi:DNA-directed RNA polymerase specialized sigma24 family protein
VTKRKPTVDDINNALVTLPMRQRMVVELIDFKKLSMRQAGLVLGISARCVHKNYYRAMVNIKAACDRLADNGG